jgi:host factor-I protein
MAAILPGTAQMDKPAQNIQDSFLNNARKDKGVVTIYLLSGVKLSGRIRSFDKYSLVMETNNQEQLIFKHAISTVVTMRSSHSYASGPSPHPVSSAAAAAGPAGAPVTSTLANPLGDPAAHSDYNEG